MPNDLTAKRNLLNSRSESPRQKLTSSGFTASIWTISGVVLVACGAVEDFLGLDDGGGGGGRSVHVQSSPVQGARIYFDADGDGTISAPERAAQDAFRPEGFVSDENGNVPDIPAHLYGTPFIAFLDGAFDADTDEPLSGTLHSIPDENGDHTLASPITDFIAGEVMRQAEPLTHEQLADAIDDIVERIIEIDPDADTEAAVDEFLGMVSEPTNYDGSSGIDALARYFVTEAEAQRTPTEALVEAEVAKFLGDDPTAPFTADVTESAVTIGAHDEYIATIEAVSHGGSVRYDFVDADGMPADVSDYIINERGVILVAEGATPTESTTLYVMVSNTGSTDTETVSVAVTVADAPSLDELPAGDEVATIMENTPSTDPLISGITPATGSTVTATDFVIREAVPAGLDFLVKRLEIVADGNTFNLALKNNQSLDHEAIPGGVLNLHVWAVENGVRSNALEIAITVTDANDAPVFLNAVLNPDLNYAPEIAETTAIGTEIAQVEARDVDSAVVTYAITNGNVALLDGNGDPTGEMLFSIGGDGAITLQSALDYETTPNTYTLTVTATDSNGATAPQDATVTITVTDINDESPTVAPTAGTGTVRIMSAADNAAGTGTGYTITVTDDDANNDFNVSITGDPRFDFRRQTNTNTWELFLDTDQAVADSELNNQITLTYTVTDGGVGTIAARGTVTLTVVDTPVDFTPPEPSALMVAENDNSWSLQLEAVSDAGGGDTSPIAGYAFVGTVPDGFAISSDGLITLTGTGLDYETATSHSLTVRATDSRTPPETGDIPLTITVGDVNEHAPAFAQSAYAATISESRTAAEGSFLEITATDADGTNDVVTYSITAGDPDDLFFIDPNSGALRVADGATLNYDTTPATTGYTLTITASDGGDNPPADAMTATEMVTITLSDVNDESPSVPNPAPTGTAKITAAAENPNGIGTGYTVTVSDADASNTIDVAVDGDPRFDFVDRGNNVWELVLLANQAILPTELGDTIALTYTVTDDGVDTIPATGSFVLTVVDTPVSITPPTDADLMADENDANWALQLEAVSDAGGGDTSPIATYEFVDGSSTSPTSGIFAIDDNGRITITSAFDFEDNNPNSYELTVRATDSRDDPESDEITFTISVQNADDGTAQFTISGTVEAGETLTIANPVPDPDGYAGSINYIWYWEDGSVADINAEDRFKRLLDENDNPHTGETYTIPAGQDLTNVLGYAIDIEYTDNFGFIASVANETALNLYLATTTVHFAAGKGDAPQTITINENDATPAALPTLEATADGGGAITYAITGGNTGDKFQIADPTTGIITLKSGALDYESDATQYTLEITATDKDDSGDTNMATVIVNVRDTNEADPVIAGGATATASISEDATAGTVLTTVTATDADTADTLTYAITGGTGMSLFTIADPSSGEITLTGSLDRETEDEYTLTVTVTDDGVDNTGTDAPRTATQTITVSITDVEDSDPTWTTGNAPNFAERAAVASDTETGFSITLSDDDTDAVNDHNVVVTGTHASRFKFVEDGTTANQWNLVLISGQEVDREAGYVLNDILTIEYQVMDGTRFTSSPASTVGITITDINDNKPVIPDQVFISTYASGVPESAGTIALFANDGVNPGVLLVNDADLNQSFTYRIVSIDGVAFGDITNPLFVIQSTSGRFGSIGNLDYETAQSHTVVFEVTDQGGMVSEHKEVVITVLNADDGDATYAVSGSVAEDATLTAMLVAGREDPDGVDSSVDVMYRWFRKASADLAPTSFETLETATFKWLGAESTTNTYTISGMPVAGQYGVLVGYKDNSVGDALSFVPVIASALKFTESSYSGSIDEDGNNITTIDIDATLDDSADNITYAFVTDADAGTTAATHKGFAIDSDGVITFTGTAATDIDYDTDPRTEQIELTVRATYDDSNNATPNPFSDVDVVVTINDLNDNPPTAKPSATTDALAEQSFSTHLPRKTGITFTIEDVDSVGSNTVMASDFVVYAGASGTTTDDRFEVADLGGTWTLRLKANEELDYEEENSDNDPTITLRVAINDGTHTPIPSDAITITAEDRNDAGVVLITRDTATKTLTATLTDQDGILTAADGATPPSYEWFDVATGEKVGTDSNTFTYTDDNAHYRVRVEYRDVWGGANLVNRAESSTASISLSRNIAFLLEHDTFGNVPLSATLTSDGSAIPSNELTLAFVLPDGTTATTYKGVAISNGFVMAESADRLNYEALTLDEQTNGIKLIIRATHDGNSVDIAFSVRVSNRNEVVSFGDDYTDYLKTINLLDGRTIATTETIHTATATADSGMGIGYTLSGTDADLFMIDSTSGAVTFKAATTLDSSMKDSYEFEVIATETGTSNTERQSVTIDVSSIRFTSADTVDRTAANVNHNIDLGHTDHFVKNIETERSNSAGVSIAITGGADKDLFDIDGLIAQGGTSTLNLRIDHQNFVKKSQYEVEITATNIVTMEPVVQMFTLTVAGYPDTPPVVKLPAGTAADYTTPINIDDEDIDIITFTIEDPDKDYAASAISVVGSDGMADDRFMVTWDESTQTGTLQAAGGGVDFSKLSLPTSMVATDPRWTSTFIRVTDTPEGSIASGDDVRVVLRVAERSVVIGPGQDTHSINDSDVGTSGSLLVAVIANVTVEGTSATVGWAITGGEDAALFFLADRAGHGTNVRLNFGHADFVKKAEYKVKLTATNSVTEDTDDIEITLTVNNFVAPAPAITPDRQEEAHAPYDPDDPYDDQINQDDPQTPPEML